MSCSMSSSDLLAQGTVRQPFSCGGIGVHGGLPVRVTVSPCPPGTGILFVRTDRDEVEIPGDVSHVVDTRFCTTLGNSFGETIATVEHLLAALWAFGIDNARIEVSGPELPILDGSAAPWVALIQEAGIVRYRTPRKTLRISEPLYLEEGQGWIRLEPSETFSLSVTAPLGDGEQVHRFSYRLGDSFEHEVAAARTFSQLEHVEKMQAMGLIRGGSLANALVFDGEGRVLNPEGLRFNNECARHKALDLLGDWSLGLGLLKARVTAHATGHGLNHRMLRKILEVESQRERCLRSSERPQGAPLAERYFC